MDGPGDERSGETAHEIADAVLQNGRRPHPERPSPVVDGVETAAFET